MANPDQIVLITVETPPDGGNILIGEMVYVSVVHTSNFVFDLRETVQNYLGGRMQRYERLLQITLERGLQNFREELSRQGYDGALGVRFCHPQIVDGGAELVIYGTGFTFDINDSGIMQPDSTDLL
ncbi:MAG: heavy metal-binding domain-containing protein [Rhodobacteraceae bacterium]|nr:heavy metal-binding domain-containing protein [Paracoccaceae bacterium]